MDLYKSQTEKNLHKAFEFTAKRRTEYDIYALIAAMQGYDDVAKILAHFADNEKEHARLWYKWQYNGEPPKLLECIKSALCHEKKEIEGVYKAFAEKAKEEGFDHIAGLLENIEIIERVHYERLQKLIWKVEDNVKPNEDGTFNWVCSVCGAVFTQKEEPKYCILCLNENVFFYKKNDNKGEINEISGN